MDVEASLGSLGSAGSAGSAGEMTCLSFVIGVAGGEQRSGDTCRAAEPACRDIHPGMPEDRLVEVCRVRIGPAGRTGRPTRPAHRDGGCPVEQDGRGVRAGHRLGRRSVWSVRSRCCHGNVALIESDGEQPDRVIARVIARVFAAVRDDSGRDQRVGEHVRTRAGRPGAMYRPAVTASTGDQRTDRIFRRPQPPSLIMFGRRPGRLHQDRRCAGVRLCESSQRDVEGGEIGKRTPTRSSGTRRG